MASLSRSHSCPRRTTGHLLSLARSSGTLSHPNGSKSVRTFEASASLSAQIPSVGRENDALECALRSAARSAHKQVAYGHQTTYNTHTHTFEQIVFEVPSSLERYTQAKEQTSIEWTHERMCACACLRRNRTASFFGLERLFALVCSDEHT